MNPAMPLVFLCFAALVALSNRLPTSFTPADRMVGAVIVEIELIVSNFVQPDRHMIFMTGISLLLLLGIWEETRMVYQDHPPKKGGVLTTT